MKMAKAFSRNVFLTVEFLFIFLLQNLIWIQVSVCSTVAPINQYDLAYFVPDLDDIVVLFCTVGSVVYKS